MNFDTQTFTFRQKGMSSDLISSSMRMKALSSHLFFIQGYILNPATEKYVFTKEFILSIRHIPKTNFYSTNTYSTDELKELKGSKNESLESFIADKNNIGDYEALFEELSKSVLLTMMVSDVDLKGYAKDGVISMMDSGPLAQMFTDDVGMQQYFHLKTGLKVFAQNSSNTHRW